MNSKTSPTTPTNSFLPAALKATTKGMPVFPCGEMKKTPLTAHGFQDATTDEAVVRQWGAKWPNANLAIPTGERSGLIVLDVDKDEGKDGEAALQELVERNGALPPTLEVKTPRGGRHLFFRHPGQRVPTRTNHPAPALDVRGDGGYVLIPPSVTERGAYAYANRAAPAECPPWLLALLLNGKTPADNPHPAPAAPEPVNDPAEDEERIREALRFIPADDYETWTKIGMALHAWHPQRGLSLWDEWARTCPEKYDERSPPRKWASFKADKPDGVKLGTLFEYAKRGGWTPPPAARVFLGGRSAAAAEAATGHPSASPSWPAAPDPACFHGLAGEIVRTIEPHTEADPLALLSQLLVFFGSCTGRAPHFTAEADRHGMNEFLLLIGETSKGRKGTSAGHVRRLFEAVDPTWARERIQSGLSSGEGLVWAVRDPIEKVDKDGETCLVDPGEPDKRLLAMESEFAGTLHNIERQGNTLSAAIRNLWDSGTVRTLTKNSPAKTTDAHVSIVGHITRDELLRYMSRTELANGFANRFLFVAVRRSKMLPEGGNLEEGAMYPLTERLRDAVSFARTVAEMRRDEEARALWHAVYPRLSEGKRGLLGGILSRAEAHTMRLAGLYALLDQSATIRRDHLTAALAFWEYVEESAAWIFGDSLGDPEADTILRQLRLRPEGLTRTEINNLFGRHLKADQIERALVLLLDRRLAECRKADTTGRPAEVFIAL